MAKQRVLEIDVTNPEFYRFHPTTQEELAQPDFWRKFNSQACADIGFNAMRVALKEGGNEGTMYLEYADSRGVLFEVTFEVLPDDSGLKLKWRDPQSGASMEFIRPITQEEFFYEPLRHFLGLSHANEFELENLGATMVSVALKRKKDSFGFSYSSKSNFRVDYYSKLDPDAYLGEWNLVQNNFSPEDILPFVNKVNFCFYSGMEGLGTLKNKKKGQN
jgi:hypothetical protein